MDDLGICTMCEQAPATTVWGLPVCQACAGGLDALDVDLKEMEADDADLAAKGRAVHEAIEALYMAQALPQVPVRIEVTPRIYRELQEWSVAEEAELIAHRLAPPLVPQFNVPGVPVFVDPTVPDPPGWRTIWPKKEG